MSVIKTDKWLLDAYDDPTRLCEKFVKYFDDASASEIHHHLTRYGMYHRPQKGGTALVKKLQHKKIWQIIQKEEEELKKRWGGPNVPIFILPAEANDRKLKRDFNGKSGLAFKDKLFLFVTEENEEQEIKALFTHEYNHVCRLGSLAKNEEDYVLLDTVILEGMAENAVRERLGDEFVAAWTAYYSDQELKKMCEKLLWPNRLIQYHHPKHEDILYGMRFYPKMAGYCMGYYLVKQYMKAKNLSCKELLDRKAETIAQLKDG